MGKVLHDKKKPRSQLVVLFVLSQIFLFLDQNQKKRESKRWGRVTVLLWQISKFNSCFVILPWKFGGRMDKTGQNRTESQRGIFRADDNRKILKYNSIFTTIVASAAEEPKKNEWDPGKPLLLNGNIKIPFLVVVEAASLRRTEAKSG